MNRYLYILIFIIGSIFSVLAFGNPQWNKHIYIFQKYYLNVELPHRMACPTSLTRKSPEDPIEILPGNSFPHPLPPQFDGPWTVWGEDGQWLERYKIKNGCFDCDAPFLFRNNDGIVMLQGHEITNIFNSRTGIDRREEFGIPVK